jgi:magnesium-protoporphyrin IX monomethyl ester (oxidative) cyclase
LNILLVCPKYTFQGYTPTGLASIAAIAESLGHTVRIIDLNIEDLPKQRTYDLVGITGLALWKNAILRIATTLRRNPIIVGGPWASLYPHDALSHPAVDYVCVGEGEDTFNEFLTNYPDIEDVRGIGYKSNDNIKVNPKRLFITDLDRLSLPAWHLIKTEKYRRISIVSSRGCPYHCIFCSAHTLLGRRWRARSPASVIEEIVVLANYHGVKHITFGDDNFTLDPQRAMAICDGIIDADIDTSFDAIQGVRADHLPYELLEKMRQANFTEIIVAPESGSQRVLDEVIHKHLDLSIVEPTVAACHDLGIHTGAFFVIGFPWETMEEIQMTIAFADKLRAKYGCSCYVGNALPYPDTELYARARAEGYLRFDGADLAEKLYVLDKPRPIHCLSSPYWTPEDIVEICRNEWKKNLRSVYKQYSLKQVFSKVIRHPIRAIQRGLRAL